MPICNLVHARARDVARFLPVLLLASMAACGQAPAPTTELEVPAAPGASLPRLSTDPDGQALLSWVEPAGSGHALRYARLEEGGWSQPGTAAEGGDWFLNWADFPSVVHLGSDLMGAHWLQKVDGGPYAYHVRMAVSRDGGAHWSDPVSPHQDRSATEHGFVSLFATEQGVGAAWLDGRNTAAGSGHQHDHAQHHAPGEPGAGVGAMTLRAGAVSADGSVRPDIELDGMTCDCCPTAMAPIPGGVVLVYRDRTPGEIRDIFSVRLDDTGWSTPAAVARDDWYMPACPVNGPAVASYGEHLAAAWFTAAGGVPRVRLAFSIDGGRQWNAAADVAAGDVVGRVAVVMDGADSAVVSWLGHADRQAEIRYRRVDRSGRSGKVQTLATTSPARSSGFPQMTLADGRLLFAWTAAGEPATIRTVLVPIP